VAWNLTGELVESCSCNMFCPCWYGVRELMVMDRGWCGTPLLFRIQNRSSNGINLSGLTVVVTAFFPGPTLYDGNATARLFVEDSTTNDQRREMEAIMQGKQGGPMEVLASLISQWLPTESTRIDVHEQNGAVTANIGNIGQIRSERLKNEAGQQVTMQNAGIAMLFQLENNTAELAPSEGSRWSDPDMPQQWESRSGAVGRFTWSVN
jgi:hypothetical protein